MFVEAIRKLIEKLSERMSYVEVGKPYFAHPPYKVYEINPSCFNPIKRLESDRRIFFVDGGNNSILEGAGVSIQYNRVYFNIFNGGLRVNPVRIPEGIDFLSASINVLRDEQPFFETIILPLNESFKNYLPTESDLLFSFKDRSIIVGSSETEVTIDFSRVSSMARRFAELQLAYHLVKEEMAEGDILVLDRTLQTSYTNESKYSDKLFEAANNKGVIVSGLSKTNRVFTTTGMALLEAVQLTAKEVEYDRWYILLAESSTKDHNAAIFAVKLNPISEYVFRYEILGEQYSKMSDRDLGEVLWKLCENSSDLCFPGYPYGLISVDRFARVRFNEIEAYKTILISELSKTDIFEKIISRVKSANAHEVLDNLASEFGGV